MFWVCLFIVNLTLLRMQHNWTGWSEFFIFGCALHYFAIAAILSTSKSFPIVYKFWDESTSSPSAWYGAILSICTLYTIDYMAAYTLRKIKQDFINPAFKTNLFETKLATAVGSAAQPRNSSDDYIESEMSVNDEGDTPLLPINSFEKGKIGASGDKKF